MDVARRVGDLQPIAQPQHGTLQVREPPGIDTRDWTAESAFQLASAREHVKRPDEIASPPRSEAVVVEEDVLLRREVDLRSDVVHLLGPFREIDHAVQDRLRAVAREIDPIEVNLRAVEPEPGPHVGPERLVRLNLDGPVRERGIASIVVRGKAAVQRNTEIP